MTRSLCISLCSTAANALSKKDWEKQKTENYRLMIVAFVHWTALELAPKSSKWKGMAKI